ncbi:hypothetical protein F5X99DRAFT_387583 [Biscogniauxia marginata]|nr:hypothetical protein F5X99DRAFT_387583 [Biscogniauxia marginata]
MPRAGMKNGVLSKGAGRCHWMDIDIAAKRLSKKHQVFGSAWLATSGDEKSIVKDVPQEDFSNFNENIRPKAARKSVHTIRLLFDTIPGQRTYVYKHLSDGFLSLVKKKIQKHISRAS